MPPFNPISSSKPSVLVALFLCVACADAHQPARRSKPTAQAVTTASGLVYEVVETGSGPTAEAGDTALIHETTQLADGTILVDTWAMNHPIRFLLGGNQVIEGMDEAVTGMRGRRAPQNLLYRRP